MIKKIDIKKFGQFNQYQWNAMIGADLQFKRMNIIYGRNYSGKTTLSRVFRCLEKDELHKNYCDGEFAIELSDGRAITHKDISAGNTALNFRVYNRDFVTENLSWLHNTDGTIVPFTVLGTQNVEIEAKVKEIDGQLGSVTSGAGLFHEYDQLQKTALEKRSECNQKQSHLERQLTDRAREIKSNSLLYNRAVYHSTHIKSDLAGVSDTDILAEAVEEELKVLLKEEPKQEVRLLREAKPSFEGFYNRTKLLVEKRISPSKPITELVEDVLLQEWVRSGIEKHKNKRTSCGFCGNVLPENLWEKLDAHFDQASETLRNEIINLIDELESAKSSLSGYLILHREQYYTELRPRFEALLTQWEEKATLYQANIEELLLALVKRRDAIFSSFHLHEISDVSGEILSLIIAFNALSRENNERTRSLSKDQEEARDKLRLSTVAGFKKTIDYSGLLTEIDLMNRVASEKEGFRDLKQQQINQLQEQKRVLEAQAQDESRGAELVNRYLEHFFGHQELKLVADGEQNSLLFKVKRDDQDAQNLSEGECSLISFCYFIAKMQNELETDPENLYIYIDDPISSLDSNHVFFIFSLIENVIAKHKKYTQLFISTHSLDFLKYIKRLTPPPGEQQTAYFIMQKRGKNMTSLIKAPAYLKKYITEFNYLFSEIHACTVESEQALADKHHYGFANNMRKFLESYLFFKYPNHKLKLEQRIEKFFAKDGIATTLVNRIINEYSHLEEQFDRGIVPIDIDEIRKLACAVLEQIKEKDPDQYEELCKSVEISPVQSWRAVTIPPMAPEEVLAN